MRSEFDNFDEGRFSTLRRLAAAVLGILVLGTVYLLMLRTTVPTNLSTTTTDATANCPKCTDKCFYGSKVTASDPLDELFNIKIVSDMDKLSKVVEDGETKWKAILKQGSLLRRASTNTYTITWENSEEMFSLHSFKGRGMELSELVRFDGRLLTFDDTTGIVYEVIDNHVVPWTILVDGDRRHGTKGFKTEWATVKGNLLFVGSIGKEWTDGKTGALINRNPQFIKTITTSGHVTSLDWSANYNKLRTASGTADPGYMVHESANWHPQLSKWVFLPRRMSKLPYNEVEDERRAANKLILASEDFSKIEVVDNIGPASEVRGFSAFRFIPNHPTEFVALKSVEDGPVVETYITVLNMKGEVLLPETLIDSVKFEGLEVVPN
eukprot:c7276_g1_i2.p1 GENE.c7276_g1_i2~~c7276_g1_i2.p1  ORF type:complete len:419 (-),score=114.48 c7276_g1_i2:109-1251(-)